jgi:hypothetical protein
MDMMRETTTHEVATHLPSGSTTEFTRARVTLPRPPWGPLDPDDRAATAPTAPTIRGAGVWTRDPVLRHADTRRDRG